MKLLFIFLMLWTSVCAGWGIVSSRADPVSFDQELIKFQGYLQVWSQQHPELLSKPEVRDSLYRLIQLSPDQQAALPKLYQQWVQATFGDRPEFLEALKAYDPEASPADQREQYRRLYQVWKKENATLVSSQAHQTFSTALKKPDLDKEKVAEGYRQVHAAWERGSSAAVAQINRIRLPLLPQFERGPSLDSALSSTSSMGGVPRVNAHEVWRLGKSPVALEPPAADCEREDEGDEQPVKVLVSGALSPRLPSAKGESGVRMQLPLERQASAAPLGVAAQGGGVTPPPTLPQAATSPVSSVGSGRISKSQNPATLRSCEKRAQKRLDDLKETKEDPTDADMELFKHCLEASQWPPPPVPKKLQKRGYVTGGLTAQNRLEAQGPTVYHQFLHTLEEWAAGLRENRGLELIQEMRGKEGGGGNKKYPGMDQNTRILGLTKKAHEAASDQVEKVYQHIFNASQLRVSGGPSINGLESSQASSQATVSSPALRLLPPPGSPPPEKAAMSKPKSERGEEKISEQQARERLEALERSGNAPTPQDMAFFERCLDQKNWAPISRQSGFLARSLKKDPTQQNERASGSTDLFLQELEIWAVGLAKDEGFKLVLGIRKLHFSPYSGMRDKKYLATLITKAQASGSTKVKALYEVLLEPNVTPGPTSSPLMVASPVAPTFAPVPNLTPPSISRSLSKSKSEKGEEKISEQQARERLEALERSRNAPTPQDMAFFERCLDQKNWDDFKYPSGSASYNAFLPRLELWAAGLRDNQGLVLIQELRQKSGKKLAIPRYLGMDDEKKKQNLLQKALDAGNSEVAAFYSTLGQQEGSTKRSLRGQSFSSLKDTEKENSRLSRESFSRSSSVSLLADGLSPPVVSPTGDSVKPVHSPPPVAVSPHPHHSGEARDHFKKAAHAVQLGVRVVDQLTPHCRALMQYFPVSSPAAQAWEEPVFDLQKTKEVLKLFQECIHDRQEKGADGHSHLGHSGEKPSEVHAVEHVLWVAERWAAGLPGDQGLEVIQHLYGTLLPDGQPHLIERKPENHDALFAIATAANNKKIEEFYSQKSQAAHAASSAMANTCYYATTLRWFSRLSDADWKTLKAGLDSLKKNCSWAPLQDYLSAFHEVIDALRAKKNPHWNALIEKGVALSEAKDQPQQNSCSIIQNTTISDSVKKIKTLNEKDRSYTQMTALKQQDAQELQMALLNLVLPQGTESLVKQVRVYAVVQDSVVSLTSESLSQAFLSQGSSFDGSWVEFIFDKSVVQAGFPPPSVELTSKAGKKVSCQVDSAVHYEGNGNSGHYAFLQLKSQGGSSGSSSSAGTSPAWEKWNKMADTHSTSVGQKDFKGIVSLYYHCPEE